MKKVELQLGDKIISFHFGLGFFEKALDGENIPNGDITKVKPIRQMYYSAAFAAEVKGEEFMSIYEWYDFLDDFDIPDFEAAISAFTAALYRSMEKKMNLDAKGKKEFEKAVSELEKKGKPQKVATAAK